MRKGEAERERGGGEKEKHKEKGMRARGRGYKRRENCFLLHQIRGLFLFFIPNNSKALVRMVKLSVAMAE